MRGLRLAIALLQDKRARAVEHTDLVGRDGGGVASGLKPVARGLAAQQFDARVIDESRERADRVGTAAHAGHDDVGQTPLGGQQLGARLVADHALKVSHELREGVRASGRSEDVVGRLDVGHPVAERLVNCILKGCGPGGHRDDLGAQHLHASHVESLTFSVLAAHVDRALEAQQRGRRRGGHAVLPSASLGDDARLAELLGQ